MKNIWFIVILFLSLLVVFLGNIFLFQHAYVNEMVLGWGLAYVNYQVGVYIKTKSAGKTSEQFLVFVLGLNGLRVSAFILLILLVISRMNIFIYSFIFSIFVAHFIFLAYDITKMANTL